MHTIEDIYNDIKNGASLMRIHKRYGGFSIYIAKHMPNYKEELLKEFNGYNFDKLADKYNITTSHVRQIIKENKN